MGLLTTRHRAIVARDSFERRKLSEIARSAFEARVLSRSRREPVLPFGAAGVGALVVLAFAATIVTAMRAAVASVLELQVAAQAARYAELAQSDGGWEIARRVVAEARLTPRGVHRSGEPRVRNRFAALASSSSTSLDDGGHLALINKCNKNVHFSQSDFRSIRKSGRQSESGARFEGNVHVPAVLAAPLIPIPPSSKSRSRRDQQRARQARASAVRCNAALRGVAVLGEWGGGGSRELGGGRMPWARASRGDQAESLRVLHLASDLTKRLKAAVVSGDAVASLPLHVQGRLAIQRLARENSTYGQAPRGALVRSVLSQISLPETSTKIEWQNAGPEVCEIYNNAGARLLADGDVGTRPSGARPSGVKAAKSYADPLLKKGAGLDELVSLMWGAGMVRPITTTVGGEGVTMFTVAKAPGRQRLVFDMRMKNTEFHDPPHCHMASLESLACLELPHGEDTDFSAFSGDVPDMFYRLRTPEFLHEVFWIKNVNPEQVCRFARLAGSANLLAAYNKVEGEVVGFGFTCPPMGWNWAPFLAQKTLEHVVEQVAHLGPEGRFLHATPPPVLSPAQVPHWAYIDDYGGINVGPGCRENSEKLSAEVRTALRAAGLDAHKEQIGTFIEVLGGELDLAKRAIFPKAASLREVILATRYIVKRGRASPFQIEVLLGKWQWFFLLRRPFFSVFQNVYSFVADHRRYGHSDRTVELPGTVRGELALVLDLLPFLRADLDWPWHTEVAMVDSGPEGFGLVVARPPLAEVEAEGRSGVCGFQNAVAPLGECVLLWDWKLAMRGRWSVTEHNNVGEARVGTYVASRAARCRSVRKRRVLRFSDSQVSIGLFCKGRSSKGDLLHVSRRDAAWSLFSEIRVANRWVPTYYNLADGPSRGSSRPCVGWDSARKAIAAGLPGIWQIRGMAAVQKVSSGFRTEAEQAPVPATASFLDFAHGHFFLAFKAFKRRKRRKAKALFRGSVNPVVMAHTPSCVVLRPTRLV